MRNHETDQEVVAQGQDTEMTTKTGIIGGEVAAGAEKGMGVIERETIVVIAEAEAEAKVELEVQALTTKIVVKQGMMISAGARAGAGVEAVHTIVLHLLGVVLALARAQHHAGAPLTMEVLKSKPMERVHLLHTVFHHHQSVQALVAQAVMARNNAC